MSDVLLYQTDDDGEINIQNGVVELSGGLETSAYLSLFGGNEDDDGSDQSITQWWGNLDETLPERRYRSRTQFLLKSIPATSGNLLRIQDAVESDLAWMVEVGAASEVSASVTIPSVNRVSIVISINAFGDLNSFEFSENWGA